MIQSKRHLGLRQWNELLRWAFCISLANPDVPKSMVQLDVGIDDIEWQTFAGKHSDFFVGVFHLRAKEHEIDTKDSEALSNYFRAHIERGVISLRSFKSLAQLATIVGQHGE